MPKETDRLKLPLPLGNENVTRESINRIFEKIDVGVATRESILIPAESDLNSYITEGEYYCPTNATVGTLANSPVGVAFHLTIERHAGVVQTLTTFEPSNLQVFQRNYYVGWGPWIKVPTRDEIEAVTDRLDIPERSAITLQPGVHVVQAAQDAAFRLSGIQGHTEINYDEQIGIFGVLNPYVIRYGANLLPPFYEAGLAGSGQSIINSYSATLNASGINMGWTYQISCAANTDYTLVVTHNGMIALQDLDSAGSIIQNPGYQDVSELHIKTAANAAYLSVVIGNGSKGAGSYSFSNPMLTLGSTAKSFKPREDVILALQADLYADPVTGANADEVLERDGQYFKLRKWRMIDLLPENFDVTGRSSYTGYKVFSGYVFNRSETSNERCFMTKYDGKQLTLDKTNNAKDASDQFNVGTKDYFPGVIWISVSNSDSGWGDAYSPTNDEIKAYLMGWVMTTTASWNTDPQLYNGSGTKGWVKRYVGVGVSISGSVIGEFEQGSGVTTLPTSVVNSAWTPYQLLYQLVTPTVEPITSEGQLALNEGDNQVEVGTGIVLREVAKPQASPNYYNVNASSFPAGKLSKTVYRYLGVYKSGRKEPWEFVEETYNGIGFVRLPIALYDPSAVYSVTYLMLDKYPITSFVGSVADNEKALLTDNVSAIHDMNSRLDILEDFFGHIASEGVIDNKGRVSVPYNTDIKKGGVVKLISTPSLPSVAKTMTHDNMFHSEMSVDGKSFIVHGWGQRYFVYTFGTPGSIETTRFSNSTLPTGESLSEVSIWGDYLVMSINSSSWLLRFYKWTGGSYAKLADPAVMPKDGALAYHCFSSDGTLLVVSTAAGNWFIYRRNGDTYTKLADPTGLTLTGSYSQRMCFSPDGKYFVTARGNYNGIKVFSISGDTFTGLLDYDWGSSGNGKQLSRIVFTPDSKYIICKISTADQGPYIFPIADIKAGNYKRVNVNVSLSDYITGNGYMAISPNGKLMIIEAGDKPIGTLTPIVIVGDSFTVFPNIRPLAKTIGGVSFINDNILAVTYLGEYATNLYDVSTLINAYPVSQYSQVAATKNEGLAYALSDGKAGETHDVMQIL